MKYLSIPIACLSVVISLAAIVVSGKPGELQGTTNPKGEADSLTRLQSQALGFMTGSDGSQVSICSVTRAYMEYFLNNKKNGVSLEQTRSRMLFLFSQASTNLSEGEKKLFIDLILNTASATYDSEFLNRNNLELANRMYCASVKREIMHLAVGNRSNSDSSQSSESKNEKR